MNKGKKPCGTERAARINPERATPEEMAKVAAKRKLRYRSPVMEIFQNEVNEGAPFKTQKELLDEARRA